jgi:hypothetical protein
MPKFPGGGIISSFDIPELGLLSTNLGQDNPQRGYPPPESFDV